MWTLPAPTLLGKLDLLRQSWRLNQVLDETTVLRAKIKAAELEKADLEQALAFRGAGSRGGAVGRWGAVGAGEREGAQRVAAGALERLEWHHGDVAHGALQPAGGAFDGLLEGIREDMEGGLRSSNQKLQACG